MMNKRTVIEERELNSSPAIRMVRSKGNLFNSNLVQTTRLDCCLNYLIYGQLAIAAWKVVIRLDLMCSLGRLDDWPAGRRSVAYAECVRWPLYDAN